MKRKLLIIFSLILCLSIFGFIGCSNSADSNAATPYFYQTDIKVDVDSTYKIKLDYNGDEEIDYSSLNDEIFTVSNDGVITPVKVGKSYVVITVGNYKKTLAVEVCMQEYVLELSAYNLNMVVGSESYITANVTKGGKKTDEVVTWSADDGLLLHKDGNKVKISSNEKAYYTLTATSGSLTKTCLIKVVDIASKKLEAPALILEHCDMVKWQAVSRAEAYSVKIGEDAWREITDTQITLTELSDSLKKNESVVIYVKSIANANFSLMDSSVSHIKVEHDYIEEAVDGYDCHTVGTAKLKCSVCEREYVQEGLAREHKFENGVCIYCKEQQTAGIVYKYDEVNDVYYTSDVTSAFSDEIAYVAGIYDDGVHGEKPVTRIGPSTFLSSIDVKRIYLPESVTKIEWDAFRECLNLELVSMPGVKELDESLKNSSYGGNFFLGDTKLTSVIVPSGFKVRTNSFSSFYAADYTPQVDFYVLGNETISAKWQETSNDMISGVAYYYDETGKACESWRLNEDGEIVVNFKHSYVTDKVKNVVKCSTCGVYEDYGVIYSFDADHYVISGYTGNDGNLKVLEKYDDGINGEYPVTAVANEAFNGNSVITKVILPESVTTIGDLAFRSCENLKYVSMVGVTTLPYQNFNWSRNVKTFIVAPSLKVSANVFNLEESDTARTDIYVYGTSGAPIVDSLMNPMLYGNDNVYYLDDTLNSCMSWRFDSDGESIEKNSTKHNFVNSKCDNCGAYDAKGVKYSFINGSYVVSGADTGVSVLNVLAKYNDGKNGERDVTSVVAGAFEGNNAITKVILPESVTSIGSRAFANCKALEYVSMIGVKELKSQNFVWTDKLATIIIGTSLNVSDHIFTRAVDKGLIVLVYGASGNLTINSGTYAEDNNYFNPIKSAPVYYYNEDGVTKATWKYADENKTNFIVVPSDSPAAYDDLGVIYTFDVNHYVVSGVDEGVMEVTVLAEYCDGVHGVYPVTTIKEEAFNNNATITKVILPESVTTIGKLAFRNCTSLTYVSMIGVKELRHAAEVFNWCDSLNILVVGTELTVGELNFKSNTTNKVNLLVKGSSCNLTIKTTAGQAGFNALIDGSTVYYYNENGGANTWKYVDGVATLNN